MEAWKIDNFMKTHEEPFPKYRAATRTEQSRLVELFVKLFGTTVPMYEDWLSNLQQLTDFNAQADGFDFARALPLSAAGTNSDVAMKWQVNFESTDVIALKDLIDYFDDVWYPGTDDLEVIDLNCKWMIVVDHGGYIYRWAAAASDGWG
jgi:hypothetical protein